MPKIFSRLFDSNEKQISRLMKIVEKINSFEPEVEKLSFEEMRQRLRFFKSELAPLVNDLSTESFDSLKAPNRKKIDPKEKKINDYLYSILPEVYAIVREASKRIYNRRHFDVQLMGGIVLAEGKIAELKTGEGKTQVAWLPLVLFSLTGRGTHLVTVNDYLAKSHGEYSAFIFSELGFTVGVTEPHASYYFVPTDKLVEEKGEDIYKLSKELKIQNPGDTKGYNLKLCTKKEGYNCDILYATNNEIGFDYLRDNMTQSIDGLSQRELYFAIVDEVDSILIDEARTPLIISMPGNNSNDLYKKFSNVVNKLVEGDYIVEEKDKKSVNLTDQGVDKVEQLLGVQNIWEDYQFAHHLDNALKARFLFRNNDEYIVQNGEVLIVDDFTGRVLPGRRFGEGMHQAIEAKENVKINQESKTMATITFQNLFRLYKNLSGMTGTAVTESEEFYKIYSLEVVSIPTNKPTQRVDMQDLVYRDQESKFIAVSNEIEEKHKSGQPVLVGTTSVAKSEYLSEMLRRMGITHEVLNAKYHEREAQIISKAGQKNAVTIATNMAGRGTDIKLGLGVDELGGLYVIGTERHESRRIDNQLRGRSGRQGDKGLSRFYLSLDDEIMRIQGGMIVQKLMTAVNMDPSMPIESSLIGRTIENAQKRVEGNNFDIRKTVVEYDDVINKQREIFYSRRRTLLRNIQKSDLRNNSSEVDDTTKLSRASVLDQVKLIFKEYIDKQITSDLNEEEIFNEFSKLFEDRLLIDVLKNDLASDLNTINLPEIFTEKLGKFENFEQTKEYLLLIVNKAIQYNSKEVGEIEFLSTYFNLLLQVMDELWMEHLETMNDIRSGIFLNSYAQKDPLIEYKNIGFDRFDKMISHINHYVTSKLLRIKRVVMDKVEIEQLLTNISEIENSLNSGMDVLQNSTEKKDFTIKSDIKEIKFDKEPGRNDSCPCGSGKKYKNCHGKLS